MKHAFVWIVFAALSVFVPAARAQVAADPDISGFGGGSYCACE